MRDKRISFLCPSCQLYVTRECAGLPNACEDRMPFDVYPEYFTNNKQEWNK